MSTLLLPCLAAASLAAPAPLPAPATPTAEPRAAVQDPAADRTAAVVSRSVALQAPASATDGLFPMPQADLVLGAAGEEGGPSLLDVVNEYGRLTNQAFLHTQELRQQLENTPAGLSMSVVVPKTQVQGWFEQILVQHGMILDVLQAEAPRMLRVYGRFGSDRNTLRDRAIFIGEDQLAVYAQHPALLVTTSVILERADVRQLSNSMRVMVTDSNLQMMLPIGDTNSITITDLAPRAHAMARMLREADANASLPVQEVDPDPVFVRVALQHADATETAILVEELVSTARPTPNPRMTQAGPVPAPPVVRVLPDSRTNALAIMVLPRYRELALDIVARLDVAK